MEKVLNKEHPPKWEDVPFPKEKSHAKHVRQSQIVRGLGWNTNKQSFWSLSARANFKNGEKDIPFHCLPALSEISDNSGYRKLIFIGNNTNKACNYGKNPLKTSDKNMGLIDGVG